MLAGVHLIDFGNHRDTRLTFGRLTALVGQNGAGKTTVMRALQQVGNAVQDPNYSSIPLSFTRSGGSQAIITASWSQRREGPVSRTGLHLAGDVHWIKNRRKEDNAVWLPDRFPPESDNSEWEEDPAVPKEIALVKRPYLQWFCRYFKTNAASLQRSAYADPDCTELSDDGSNLAWVLASAMTEHPLRFQEIVRSLTEIVPMVSQIRARPLFLARSETQTITVNRQERTFQDERKVAGQELLFDMRSGGNLPASSISEGTLVTLAILALVHGAKETDMILLDDVELGLHPKAQRDLIRQLRRIQEMHPRLQIILSTHSPYVVDELKPEEVWVFAPDTEGCAVTHRLDEHPNATRALEVLTTGEFWSAEGEGWVLGADGTETDPVSARVAEEPPTS